MDVEDFVAISAQETVSCKGLDEAGECLAAFLDDLLQELRRGGCEIIGHIKGMVACDSAEPLFFSITSFDSDPRLNGCLLESSPDFILTMNIIVAGIDEPRLMDILNSALERHFIRL